MRSEVKLLNLFVCMLLIVSVPTVVLLRIYDSPDIRCSVFSVFFRTADSAVSLLSYSQQKNSLSDLVYSNQQAVVLEGNYWKRRLESVTTEYKKWRKFFFDQSLVGRKAQEKSLMDDVRYFCQRFVDLLLFAEHQFSIL